MAVFNQEKELQKLDYELEKNRINTEITNTLESVLSLFKGDGVVLKDISIRDFDFSLVVFHPSGIYAFVKEESELTDLKLQDRLEDVYRTLISEVDEYEDDFFCLFAMLNTPVSQKMMIGRFEPDSEYVSAVKDLDIEIAELLKERKAIFLQDELMEMANRLIGEEDSEDKSSIESTSIKVGGVYRPRSELDPEKYYKKALYGGLIGLHKFYAKKI